MPHTVLALVTILSIISVCRSTHCHDTIHHLCNDWGIYLNILCLLYQYAFSAHIFWLNLSYCDNTVGNRQTKARENLKYKSIQFKHHKLTKFYEMSSRRAWHWNSLLESESYSKESCRVNGNARPSNAICVSQFSFVL